MQGFGRYGVDEKRILFVTFEWLFAYNSLKEIHPFIQRDLKGEVMKSAKTIVIVASVVFGALCLRAYSAEQDDAAPAKVVPTTPTRVTPPRIPTHPAPTLEEETPIPKPVTRTPTRATPPRTPSRRPTTPSRRIPTRPIAVPGASRPTPGRRPRPPQDPHKDTVILVEAFMVEVRLSALRSLGVPQISEGCKSVSAEHIIKLMKTTDAAVVTAGAKVAVGQKSEAKTKSTTQRPILSGPPEKKRTVYFDVGTQFMAAVEVRSDDKIFAEMEFEHSAIEEGDDKTDRDVRVGRDFSSSVLLQNGKPPSLAPRRKRSRPCF
jgi:hypothetical protein